MKCETCNGNGFIEQRQAHPYGSTVAVETLTEECESCNGKGVVRDLAGTVDELEKTVYAWLLAVDEGKYTQREIASIITSLFLAAIREGALGALSSCSQPRG